MEYQHCKSPITDFGKAFLSPPRRDPSSKTPGRHLNQRPQALLYVVEGDMKIKTTLILAAVLACVAAGCRESDPRVPKAEGDTTTLEQDVRGKISDAGATFDEQKRRAEVKMSEELKDLDAKMAELKAKAQTAGDKAKAEWETQRPKLEAQRAEAAKRLDEIKASTKETWAEVSSKSEAAFDELRKGFKEAWAKLTE